ncbi:MAG TPA: sulfite exporter TauE/SafE family protein, partial [Pirellulales bacterium]
GGGVFKVPALHLACGVPIKAVAATSNFMIGVTATASAFLYFGRGQVWADVTAAVVLGVLFGSVVGSIVNQRIGGKAINRLFAVLLLGCAIEMFFRVVSG